MGLQHPPQTGPLLPIRRIEDNTHVPINPPSSSPPTTRKRPRTRLGPVDVEIASPADATDANKVKCRLCPKAYPKERFLGDHLILIHEIPHKEARAEATAAFRGSGRSVISDMGNKKHSFATSETGDVAAVAAASPAIPLGLAGTGSSHHLGIPGSASMSGLHADQYQAQSNTLHADVSHIGDWADDVLSGAGSQPTSNVLALNALSTQGQTHLYGAVSSSSISRSSLSPSPSLDRSCSRSSTGLRHRSQDSCPTATLRVSRAVLVIDQTSLSTTSMLGLRLTTPHCDSSMILRVHVNSALHEG